MFKPLFSEESLDLIADHLSEHSICILNEAIPQEMVEKLYDEALSSHSNFRTAGVGRKGDHQIDKNIRGDQILWMSDKTELERWWLENMDAIMRGLNRRLFLGLFSHEAHYAHYVPGAFYEKHVDAFYGRSNRILSMVTYLNPEWRHDWGGELLIYDRSSDQEIAKELPSPGKIVMFMSEGIPHEVLVAEKDRYSIAGWFRCRE